MNEILTRERISLREMKAEMSLKFNINVTIAQCRNAKKQALEEIQRTLEEHYSKLWRYDAEIKRANPR